MSFTVKKTSSVLNNSNFMPTAPTSEQINNLTGNNISTNVTPVNIVNQNNSPIIPQIGNSNNNNNVVNLDANVEKKVVTEQTSPLILLKNGENVDQSDENINEQIENIENNVGEHEEKIEEPKFIKSKVFGKITTNKNKNVRNNVDTSNLKQSKKVFPIGNMLIFGSIALLTGTMLI